MIVNILILIVAVLVTYFITAIYWAKKCLKKGIEAVTYDLWDNGDLSMDKVNYFCDTYYLTIISKSNVERSRCYTNFKKTLEQ